MSEQLKWYVIHTHSGFEEKAKIALLERAKEAGLQEKIGEVHISQTVKESTTKTGKKRQTMKNSFPGYIVVQMILDDSTMHLVNNTPKITGFVGNAKSPRPLPQHEVTRMITGEGSVPEKEAVVVIDFARGDGVKVLDGPFSNFDGVIDEVRPEKGKVRVLVSIFGRETPVELDFAQVKKV